MSDENPEALDDQQLESVAGGNAPVYYTVKKGDSLGDIAKRFGTTPQQISLWNGITNPNYLVVGKRIIVRK